MNKSKGRLRRLGALLLAVVLLLPLTGPVFVMEASAKITQEQIDALKDEASGLASQ